MSAEPPAQLPLRIEWRRRSRFQNLVPGPNAEAVEAVRQLASGSGPRVVYVWGSGASGKTHLIEACCADATAAGRRVAYLPLRGPERLAPEMLLGLEQLDLVCLDDFEEVSGERGWEEALFALYHRLEDRDAQLLVSATAGPSGLDFALPDLRSRMGGGLVFRLRPLDDADRGVALRTHARDRGLELSREVTDFILSRHRRDMDVLVALLDRLDRDALAAQRALTVPFVRAVLDR